MAGVTKRFGKAAKLQLPNQFDRSIHDKRSEVRVPDPDPDLFSGLLS